MLTSRVRSSVLCSRPVFDPPFSAHTPRVDPPFSAQAPCLIVRSLLTARVRSSPFSAHAPCSIVRWSRLVGQPDALHPRPLSNLRAASVALSELLARLYGGDEADVPDPDPKPDPNPNHGGDEADVPDPKAKPKPTLTMAAMNDVRRWLSIIQPLGYPLTVCSLLAAAPLLTQRPMDRSLASALSLSAIC
jgi:hypothetical protein